ncbi:MAG: tetratricopeptide repeat protein [Proteobacteria bacterium]|nr:tetratricopeptide repeat protein [Pseudomonadota bacterium]
MKILIILLFNIFFFSYTFAMELDRSSPPYKQRIALKKPSIQMKSLADSDDPFIIEQCNWYNNADVHKNLSERSKEGDPVAQYFLGRVIAAFGDFENAERCDQKAKENFLQMIQSSETSDFQKGLAFWYLYLLSDPNGSVIKALKHVHQFNELHKTSLSLLYEAYFAQMAHENKKSEQLLDDAIQEGSFVGYFHKGNLCISQGKYEEALENYIKAIEHGVKRAYEPLYDVVTNTSTGVRLEDINKRFQSPLKEPSELLEYAETSTAYEKLARLYWHKKSQSIEPKDAQLTAHYYVLSGKSGNQHSYRKASEKYKFLKNKREMHKTHALGGPYSKEGEELEKYIEFLLKEAGIAL